MTQQEEVKKRKFFLDLDDEDDDTMRIPVKAEQKINEEEVKQLILSSVQKAEQQAQAKPEVVVVQKDERKAVWSREKKPKKIFVKRGVKDLVKQGFVGWARIMQIVRRAEEMGNSRIFIPTGERDAALVALLFTGGFRISELVKTTVPLAEDYEIPFYADSRYDKKERTFSYGVKLKNIKFVYEPQPEISGTTEPHILFSDIPVLKKYTIHKDRVKAIDEQGRKSYVTDRRFDVRREFMVPIREPQVEYFRKYLQNFSDPEQFVFTLSRKYVYKLIEKIDMTVFPHWFRGQRASQLGAPPPSGYGYRLEQIMEFFAWRSVDTARMYTHSGTIGLFNMIPKNVNYNY